MKLTKFNEPNKIWICRQRPCFFIMFNQSYNQQINVCINIFLWIIFSWSVTFHTIKWIGVIISDLGNTARDSINTLYLINKHKLKIFQNMLQCRNTTLLPLVVKMLSISQFLMFSSWNANVVASLLIDQIQRYKMWWSGCVIFKDKIYFHQPKYL